ncbi:hypothetical protein OKW50_004801 [Paraburkholderia youngii]
MTNTPAVPRNAAVSASASSNDAIATSAPRSRHGAALLSSRSTARTACPASSNARAAAPPTCPVTPVIANMLFSSMTADAVMGRILGTARRFRESMDVICLVT